MPDFINHPLLGTARVADLMAYRHAAPRISLRNPVSSRYLRDWSDDDLPPPVAPALPVLPCGRV